MCLVVTMLLGTNFYAASLFITHYVSTIHLPHECIAAYVDFAQTVYSNVAIHSCEVLFDGLDDRFLLSDIKEYGPEFRRIENGKACQPAVTLISLFVLTFVLK